MQRRITSREFSEWVAYDRLSPIGPERADWHAAQIACVVANAFRTDKEPYKMQNFVLQFGPRPAAQTPQEATMLLKNFFQGVRDRQREAEEQAGKRKG